MSKLPAMLGHPRRGFYLALSTWIFAAAVIVLGSFTRLVDAGLGCPDWPGCYGHLTWPTGAADVAVANFYFPEFPVDHEKTWPEMVHRYLAGTLGLLVLGLAIFAFRFRQDSDYPFRLPMFLVLLVIWQALFGMWTVTLKLWPQVVAAHLMGGFATFTLLGVLVFRLNNGWRLPPPAVALMSTLRPAFLLGLMIVVVQVFLGGWVAANYAAVACPDFPTCQSQWWPNMNMSAGFDFFQHVGPNYLGGQLEGDARTAIHFVHRLGALVTTLYLLGLIFAVWRAGANHAGMRAIAAVIAGLLVTQVGLGIANVMLNIPLAVAVLHNLFGALLMAAMAIGWLQTWSVQDTLAP